MAKWPIYFLLFEMGYFGAGDQYAIMNRCRKAKLANILSIQDRGSPQRQNGLFQREGNKWAILAPV